MLNTPRWNTSAGESFPALDRRVSADVCVVGLGGSGLACIRELQRYGLTVVGVDAATVGGGAAGRNGGFLLGGIAAFHHEAAATLGDARATRLYQLTLVELDRMHDETPDAIRRHGSLRIAADEQEMVDCDAQYAAMCRAHLPVELYRGVEGDGLLFPRDGAFDPLRRCRMLARAARDDGAEFFEHSPVTDIAPRRVVTANGAVDCQHVIVLVDGRLAHLLPELAAVVRPVRLQMLAFAPTESVSLPRPVYTRYGYDYWQQLPDRSIVAGGLRDRFVEDEYTDDPTTSHVLQSALEAVVRDRTGVDTSVTHRWAGIVGYSAGLLPFVGEVRPGVWAAGGYNGTGNIVGAICGRGLAQRIATGDSQLLRDF